MNVKRIWLWGLLAAGLAVFIWLGVALLKSTEATSSTAASPGEVLPKRLLSEGDRAAAQGQLLEAKKAYQQILQESPESPLATTAQERLGAVNLKLLLSPAPSSDAQIYTVVAGDTLSKIARQFHTTVDLLKAANGLSSDRIRPGQRLKVFSSSFSVVVDKSLNTLTLKQGEEVLKVYRCSTGQEGITPTGTFKIVNRIVDPPWFSPEGVIPSGDPRNILGSRWLGFDLAGYGIHGTTDPTSIGKPVTQGCVRLANADVEELFILLSEGTPVTVVE